MNPLPSHEVPADMPWVRIDDQFLDHPKVASHLGPLGVALHIAGIVWAARNLTDGLVPERVIPRLLNFDNIAVYKNDSDSREEMVPAVPVGPWFVLNSEIVLGDLWHDDVTAPLCDSERCREAPRPGPNEYLIHDYLAYQPSKDDVLAERSARSISAVAGGKARAAQAEREGGRFTSVATSDSPASPPAEPPAIDQPPTSRETSRKPAPVPVPVPVPKDQDLNTLARTNGGRADGTDGETTRGALGAAPGGSSSPSAPEPPGFAKWYAVYPLHQGRGAAAKAYRNARRRADADVLLDAVVRYAADPNLPTDRSKIPYPQRWLNESRWLDDPLPAQLVAVGGRFHRDDPLPPEVS